MNEWSSYTNFRNVVALQLISSFHDRKKQLSDLLYSERNNVMKVVYKNKVNSSVCSATHAGS